MIIEKLLSASQYAARQVEKENVLIPELIALTRHHVEHCSSYAKIIRLTSPDFEKSRRIDELPFLPVGLFKKHTLQSIADSDRHTILTSSGTTGQAVSRLAIDDVTARYQARALAAVMREITGGKRLPLLLIESEAVLENRQETNARSAGVLGFMALGQQPVFALDADMKLKKDAVAVFIERNGASPFLVFGFTFMIWRYFQRDIAETRLDFRNGVLVHGGGWKKLESEAVDNIGFHAALNKSCGIARIYNFYGMAEQIGTALLEGEDGLLYPPAFGDVVIRDPNDWHALPPGSPGIVQVLSLIPRSYPGHSILTEDQGVIVHIDAGNGGRMGKAVRILGRVPRAELRGCSDVHAFGAAA